MSVNILKDLSVKWRLIGFVVFLLILLVSSGIGGLYGLNRTNNTLSSVYKSSVLPLKELREIDNLFQIDLNHAVMGLLYEQISWEESLRIAEQSRQGLKQKWTKIIELSQGAGNKEDDWLSPAMPLISATANITDDIVSLIKQKDLDKIDDINTHKLGPIDAEYKNVIKQLIENRLISTKEKYGDAQNQYDFFRNVFIFIILFGGIVCLVAGYFLMRGIDEPLTNIALAMERMRNGDLTGRLIHERKDEFGVLIGGFNQMLTYLSELVSQIQKSGIQVTSSITEIASTTKQQEVTVNEYAATSSEIAASTTEIAATSANLMSTMKKVNSLTKNTAFAAEEGHSGLSNIDSTMVRMEDATRSIVDKFSILSEKAGNIAGVVKTINKIADQTNLLSLNAAIEAEKAGEYGAGFAVVATEIRRLADQTAVATYDIEQIVQEVQSAISSGVMGLDKFAEDVRTSVKDIRLSSEQLAGVIDQVKVLMPQISTVNEGIEAQSLGAKQISEATSQLNDAAQQTAESIAQTSSTIARLQQAAMGLQEAISCFKVN